MERTCMVIFWFLVGISFTAAREEDIRSERARRQSKQGFALHEREPLFPPELAGRCIISNTSGREICYPDSSILDYSCVKKNGAKNKTVPPPVTQNGRYKALITKYRPDRVHKGAYGRSSNPFLVVQYQCNDGYLLLDEAEFLFCRDYHWIQTIPICVASGELASARNRGLASKPASTNPCQMANGGCSHNCSNMPNGTSQCDCPNGMVLDPIDGRTCKEKDNPCLIDNGGCSHTCQAPVKPGLPPECICPEGSTLGSDMKTCFQASDWVVKPMECPQVPFGYPNCESQCVHDDDCEKDKKCCSNGCAYVCLSPDLVEKSLPDASINPPGPLEVRVGGQVNLTCTGSGFPLPSLVWYQNGRRMAQKHNGQGRGEQSLTISRTVFVKELFQSSVFRCEAVNDFGWKAAETNVTVLGPGSMPTSIRHRVRGTNVTVTWKAPIITNGDIIGYKLYYTTGDARKPLPKWQMMYLSTGRAVINDLEPLTRYYFRLQAVNDKAPGVVSLVFHIKTLQREVRPSVAITGFDDPYGRIEIQPLESINLTCKVTAGHPPPKLGWYREDGVSVTVPTQSSNADLVLNNLMESTLFECVAVNKHGRANASVDVVITGPGTPPQQIQYRVVDGTDIDISWGAPSIPNGPIIGYVVFYTADKPNATLDEWEVQVVEKAQSTILRNLRPLSKYHVRIQAFNELGHGPASTPVIVEIGAPWTLPNITLDPLISDPVPPGFRVNITCAANGVPPPSVMWKRAGDEVVSFPQFHPANRTVAKLMVIERIFETTSFTCEATNAAGTTVSNLEIVIQGPGSPPETVQATADRQTIAVTWDEPEYPNGEIKGYLLYFTESANDTNPLTTWPNVTIDDGQRYDWTLKNLKHNTPYTVRLSAFNVDRDGNRQEGPVSEKAYATTSRDGQPPTIVLNPAAPLIQILPGGPVNVTCTGIGVPEPQVKWYKNGKLLGSDINPDLAQDSAVSSVNLVINHMYETSSFECRANNPLGSATAGVQVDVQGPGSAPRDIYPIIYSNTIDIQWQEPVLVNGKVTGYEIAYTLDDSSDVKNWTTAFISGTTDHHKLTDLLPSKNYTYMIRAFNQKGPGPWSDRQAVITGETESKPIVTVSPATDVYKTPVGGTVNLTCSASGFPPPTVTWHVASVVNDPRFVPESQEVALSIDNVREPFSIDCIAVNPVGEGKKTIRVEVTGLGGPPMNLQGGAKGTTAHLRWDAPELIEAEIKYFLLYYTRNPGISSERWHVVSVPLRFPDETPHYYWEIGDLKPYAEYTFKVRAYTEEGPGPFSNIIALNTTEKWYIHLELHPDKTADVPVGGGVDVLCKAKGVPPPLVSWWIDGKSIAEPRPYVSILRVDPLNEVTTVTCVTQSDMDTLESSVQLVPTDRWETTSVPTTWPDEDDGGIVLDWTDLLVGAEEGTVYTIYYTENTTLPLEEWWQVRTKLPINMRLPNMTEDRLYSLRVRIFPPQVEWSIITAPTQVLTPKFPSNANMTLKENTVVLQWDDIKIPYMDISGISVYYTDDENLPLKDWHTEDIEGLVHEAPLSNVHPDKPYFVKLFIETDKNERLPTAVFKTRSPKFDRCEWAKCEYKCALLGEELKAECLCKPGYELNDDKRSCSPSLNDTMNETGQEIGDDVCLEEMDSGNCEDSPVQVWYYNSTSRECVQFTYGGCGGNKNRFDDQVHCMERCSKKPCMERRRQAQHLPQDQRPVCDENGDFDSRQVDQTKMETYCVDPLIGDEVLGTRMSVNGTGGKQYCRSCEFQRQHGSPSRPFTPTCTPEGLFESRQCSSQKHCWCVDQLTGTEIEGTKGNDTCGPASGTKLEQWNVELDDENSYQGAWKGNANETAKEYLVYFTDDPEKPMKEWNVMIIEGSKQPLRLIDTDSLSSNGTSVWAIQPKFGNELGEASEKYIFVPEGLSPTPTEDDMETSGEFGPITMIGSGSTLESSGEWPEHSVTPSTTLNETSDKPTVSGKHTVVSISGTRGRNKFFAMRSSKKETNETNEEESLLLLPANCSKIDFPLDFVIILDASNSDGATDHRLIKETLRDMLDQYFVVDPSNVHVGMIQYSAVMAVEFALGQYKDRVEMLNHIMKVPHMKGSSRTEEALVAALDIIQSNSGDRSGVPKVVLIITDGLWIGDTSLAAWQLQEASVHVLAAGVGSNITNKELLSIVAGKKERVLNYSSWKNTKRRLATDVVTKICEYVEQLKKEEIEGVEMEAIITTRQPTRANKARKATTKPGKTTSKSGKTTSKPGKGTSRLGKTTSKTRETTPKPGKTTSKVERTTSKPGKGTSKPQKTPSPRPTKLPPKTSESVSPTPPAAALRLDNVTAESAVISWEKHHLSGNIEITLTDEETGDVKRFNASAGEMDSYLVPVKSGKSYTLQLTATSNKTGKNEPFTETVKFKSPPRSNKEKAFANHALPGPSSLGEVTIVDVTIGQEITWELDDPSQDSSNWEFLIYHAEGIHWEGMLPEDVRHTIVTDGLVRGYALAAEDYPKENYTFWIQPRNKEGKGPMSAAFILARPGYKLEITTTVSSTTRSTSTSTPQPTMPSMFHSRKAPSIAPVITEVDQLSSDAAKLSWDMVHMDILPADWDFVIYYTPDPSLPREQWHLHYASASESSGFIMPDLVPEQQYTICMRARNTYGLGPSSNCVDIWLLDIKSPDTDEKEEEKLWSGQGDLEVAKVFPGYKKVPAKFNLKLDNLTPRSVTIQWERDVEWQPGDTVYIFSVADNTTGNGIRLKTPTINDQHTLAIRPNRTYSVYMISRSSKAKAIQMSNVITFQSPVDPSMAPVISDPTSTEKPAEGMNFHPIITEIDQISRTAVKVRWAVENMATLPTGLYFVIHYSYDTSMPHEQWQKVIATSSDAQRGKIIDRLRIGKHYDVCVTVRNATTIGPMSPCVPFHLADVPVPTRSPKKPAGAMPPSSPNVKVVPVDAKKPKPPAPQSHVLEPQERGMKILGPQKFNPRIDAVTPHIVSVRWNPHGPSNYTFTLMEKDTGSMVNFTSSTATDHYLLAVRPNTTYQLKSVLSNDGNDVSMSSNAITFKTPADGVDDVPFSIATSPEGGPVITGFEEVSDNSIKLQWSFNETLNTSSDSRIVIYYSPDPSLPKDQWSKLTAPTDGPSSHCRVVDNLLPDRRYMVCIELQHSDKSAASPASCTPVYLGSFPTPPPFNVQVVDGKKERGSITDPDASTENGTSHSQVTPVTAWPPKVTITPGQSGSAGPELEEDSSITPVPLSTPSYEAFTSAIPVERTTFVPSCNCTCVIDEDGNHRRCFFDNETTVSIIDSPDGGVLIKMGEKELVIKHKDCDHNSPDHKPTDGEQDDDSYYVTTPVPVERESDCPCLKPLRADQCPPGYQLWKGRCRDINECEYKNGGCSHGCVNTHGGYYCACPVGLFRDPNNPFVCLSQDELLKGMSKLMYFHMWNNAAKSQGVKVRKVDNFDKALQDHRKWKGEKEKGENAKEKSGAKALISVDPCCEGTTFFVECYSCTARG